MVASLLVLAPDSRAADYYVDIDSLGGPCSDGSNPGTSLEAPFCSVNAALSTAVCGDTITIRQGQYDERVDLNMDCTEDSVLTMEGYALDPEKPWISGVDDWDPERSWLGITIWAGGSYIVVRRLKVTQDFMHPGVRGASVAIRGSHLLFEDIDDIRMLEERDELLSTSTYWGGHSIENAEDIVIRRLTCFGSTLLCVGVSGSSRAIRITESELMYMNHHGVYVGDVGPEVRFIGLLFDHNRVGYARMSDGIQVDQYDFPDMANACGIVAYKNVFFRHGENGIDGKGMCRSVIFGNVFTQIEGVNDGGVPPNNTNWLGANAIMHGSSRYMHSVAIMSNVIYNSNGGSKVGAGGKVGHNTVLYNRFTCTAEDALADACVPGAYASGGGSAPVQPALTMKSSSWPVDHFAVVNNVLGYQHDASSLFVLYEGLAATQGLYLDGNLYIGSDTDGGPYTTSLSTDDVWTSYDLSSELSAWLDYLGSLAGVTAGDAHSVITRSPRFRNVPEAPESQEHREYDFLLADDSPGKNIAQPIAALSGEANGTRVIHLNDNGHLWFINPLWFHESWTDVPKHAIYIEGHGVVTVEGIDEASGAVTVSENVTAPDAAPVWFADEAGSVVSDPGVWTYASMSEEPPPPDEDGGEDGGMEDVEEIDMEGIDGEPWVDAAEMPDAADDLGPGSGDGGCGCRLVHR